MPSLGRWYQHSRAGKVERSQGFPRALQSESSKRVWTDYFRRNGTVISEP